jgi:H+/Cl- antiporter ClcA/CBS domain-containing protein
MTERTGLSEAATTEGLPIAPSLGPTLDALSAPAQQALVSPRVLLISGIAVVLGLAAGAAAAALIRLIALITNLSFFGRLSIAPVSPADNHLGAAVMLVPVVGALIVGLMARYGSQAIRGHGIPEAMEQVLFNQSRMAPRLTWLKPLSAAVSIGTGGPFGAEGPIIATGGALGSVVGQLLTINADERKTLLAAGAAAGMAATFGCPVSAVLLAVELLLFEYKPRSIIPVALASVAATGLRMAVDGSAPMFAIPDLSQPSGEALAAYVGIGAVIGLVAVGVTRAVYAVEDVFERLPVHWMWWPAIGAVAVGVVGYIAPRTLGVGYANITDLVSGSIAGQAVIALALLKFISWVISLGSGTSGGTLAPLFTIGAGCGAALGTLTAALAPSLGVDPRIAALVGMAAMFAGASRALLASVVFAFETTRQPLGLLPLLGGCAAAYLVSCFLMRHSIMTEKIARRGARIPDEYTADYLGQVLVRDWAAAPVTTIDAEQTIGEVRRWIDSGAPNAGHQGFPVVNRRGDLIGVVTRRDILAKSLADDARVRDAIKRPPVVTYDDNSLREAADHMVAESIGRLPVVAHTAPRRVVGMLTRSDLLAAHQLRLEGLRAERVLMPGRRRAAAASA